ncbi:MAG: DUF2510 domain-containing protein [Actinomycetota bacterium]|nr:DUF2510 domain-containing protein [Actinomycetota bacterium]
MSPNAPAGWYPDQNDLGSQRYWDGTAWTNDRMPAVPPPASDAPCTTQMSPVVASANSGKRKSPPWLVAILSLLLILVVWAIIDSVAFSMNEEPSLSPEQASSLKANVEAACASAGEYPDIRVEGPGDIVVNLSDEGEYARDVASRLDPIIHGVDGVRTVLYYDSKYKSVDTE